LADRMLFPQSTNVCGTNRMPMAGVLSRRGRSESTCAGMNPMNSARRDTGPCGSESNLKRPRESVRTTRRVSTTATRTLARGRPALSATVPVRKYDGSCPAADSAPRPSASRQPIRIRIGLIPRDCLLSCVSWMQPNDTAVEPRATGPLADYETTSTAPSRSAAGNYRLGPQRPSSSKRPLDRVTVLRAMRRVSLGAFP
jgi:hypothetical protein